MRLGLQTVLESENVISPGASDVAELVCLMRSRRSCRNYLEKPVPNALMEDLVKIGTTAPSGTNSQSWKFTIVPTRADLLVFCGKVADFYRRLNRLAARPVLRFIVKVGFGDGLGRYYRRYYESVAGALQEWDENGTDRLFHGAVAAILVSGEKEASCPGEDALLATQNILLAAHSMGLGTCLIGFVVEAMRRDSKLRKLAGITDKEEVYSVIALGYPAIDYLRPANRKIVVPRILHLDDGSQVSS